MMEGSNKTSRTNIQLFGVQIPLQAKDFLINKTTSTDLLSFYGNVPVMLKNVSEY